MPIDPSASAEITAFRWVPDFAAGLVRDLRIRRALEEIGRPCRIRLLDALNPRPDYFQEQPFGQVPAYRDEQVQLSESGAILIHLRLGDEWLLPADERGRMRGIAWLIAALNSSPVSHGWRPWWHAVKRAPPSKGPPTTSWRHSRRTSPKQRDAEEISKGER